VVPLERMPTYVQKRTRKKKQPNKGEKNFEAFLLYSQALPKILYSVFLQKIMLS
jgi:hypothetical protein